MHTQKRLMFWYINFYLQCLGFTNGIVFLGSALRPKGKFTAVHYSHLTEPD